MTNDTAIETTLAQFLVQCYGNRNAEANLHSQRFKMYELSDPLPTSSFRTKRDRILFRMPRSAPGSAGNISGGPLRLDRTSSLAEFRLRSVCRIFLSGLAFLLKFRQSVFPHYPCRRLRHDSSVRCR